MHRTDFTRRQLHTLELQISKNWRFWIDSCDSDLSKHQGILCFYRNSRFTQTAAYFFDDGDSYVREKLLLWFHACPKTHARTSATSLSKQTFSTVLKIRPKFQCPHEKTCHKELRQRPVCGFWYDFLQKMLQSHGFLQPVLMSKTRIATMTCK